MVDVTEAEAVGGQGLPPDPDGAAVPSGRVASAWATAGWFMLVMVLMQAVGLFCAALVYKDLDLSKVDQSDFLKIAAAVMENGKLLTLSVVVSMPVQVGLLVWIASRYGAPFRYLAVRLPSRSHLLLGMAALAVFLFAYDAGQWLTGRPIVSRFQLDAYAVSKATGWLPWMWMAFVVAAPVSEELLFRGFAYCGLRQAWGPWPAIQLTAVVWALMHVQYDVWGMLQVALAGLLLGWAREISGSVVLPVAMHAAMNAVATAETAWFSQAASAVPG